MKRFEFFPIFDLAFRLSCLILSLALLAFIMAAGARTAFAASLKGGEILLTNDVLTVGDLFSNPGRNAAYVLGPAPQPGQDMVLSAQTLLRVAMALDLPWQPQNMGERVIVRRAATIIPASHVLDSIAMKLAGKVPEGNFKLDTGAQPLDITLPHDMPGTVDITNIDYNPRTSRFEAHLSAPSAANPVRQMVVTGSVRAMTLVPVPKTNLRNGDIISASDLDWVEMFTADLAPDTLVRESDLIGTTPRRNVIAGRPIRGIDVQSPQLVNRGDSVTILFREGTLSLTATGKALQAGARGDVIRVVNSASNRSIDAIVTGDREVIVK